MVLYVDSRAGVDLDSRSKNGQRVLSAWPVACLLVGGKIDPHGLSSDPIVLVATPGVRADGA